MICPADLSQEVVFPQASGSLYSVDDPGEAFGRSQAVVLEVVALVPFERGGSGGGDQEVVLATDALADGRHDGGAGSVLAVAQTEVEGCGQGSVEGRIVEPFGIPNGGGGRHDTVKGMLVARPKREEARQGVAPEDRGAVGRGDEARGAQMVDDIKDRLERGRSPMAEGPLAEDGRSVPGRQLVEPTGDMDGHEDEVRSRGLGDGLHLLVHLPEVVGVGRLDQQKGGPLLGVDRAGVASYLSCRLLMERQGGSPFGIFGSSVHEKKR